MNRDLTWPGIVGASTLAMMLVAVFDLGPPIAPIIAFLFAFVCPGLPYVRLLGLREPLNELLLAIALSLSIESVVSLVLLLTSSWSPGLMLQVVVTITVLGVLVDADRVTRVPQSVELANRRRIGGSLLTDPALLEAASGVDPSDPSRPVHETSREPAPSVESEGSRS